MTLYWGETTPWQHQKADGEWLYENGSGYLAFEMGGGKTVTAIAAAAAWRSSRTLILCPKSVIGVWRREYRRHGIVPEAIIVTLERGSAKKKAAAVAEGLAEQLRTGRPLVVVCNYEAAFRDGLGETLVGAKFGTVILDESHRIKAPSGKASRFAARLGRRAEHRVCLSGTPMPHSPLDIYAQMRFLEPSVLGTSFARFRARYGISDPMFPSRIIKWINQEELTERLAPWMRRRRTGDFVDLPELRNLDIRFDLEPKSMRAYSELEKELETLVDLEEITVSNALTKLLRLQQITSGVMQLEDKVVRFGSEKEGILLDRISDLPADEPVVVFCRFRQDIEAVRRVAGKLERRFGEVSGSTKDLTSDSTFPEDVEILAVQQAAGGVGIDLTRARYGFWYSLSYSLGDFDQAQARMHRPGQRSNVTMYHLIARKTVDEAVYRALSSRRTIVEEVIERLKGNEA